MATLKRTLVYLYILCFCSKCWGSLSYVIEFEKCETEFNSNVMRNITLELINVNGQQKLNGSIIPLVDLEQFEIVFAVTIPRRNGRTSTLLNATINGCQMISGGYNGFNTLSFVIMEYLRKNIRNFPRKCPIKKDTDLCFINFSIDVNKLPPYLPENPFKSYFKVSVKKTFAFIIKVSGVTISKEKRKLQGR